MKEIPNEEVLKEIFDELLNWCETATEKGLQDEHIATYLVRMAFMCALKNGGKNAEFKDILARVTIIFLDEVQLMKDHFSDQEEEDETCNSD